jgi:hypothetical protein
MNPKIGKIITGFGKKCLIDGSMKLFYNIRVLIKID